MERRHQLSAEELKPGVPGHHPTNLAQRALMIDLVCEGVQTIHWHSEVKGFGHAIAQDEILNDNEAASRAAEEAFVETVVGLPATYHHEHR